VKCPLLLNTNFNWYLVRAINKTWDQDSVVGVETCCGLLGLKFELWLWMSRLALRLAQPSGLLILVLFCGWSVALTYHLYI